MSSARLALDRSRLLRSASAGLIAVIVVGALALRERADSSDEKSPSSVLEAGKALQWRRGNLHTHSLWSDGDDYLEMIAGWYLDHGYDFLGFTDHNVVPTIEKWIDVEKTKGGRVAYDKLKAKHGDWIDERTVEGRLQVRLRKFDEVAGKLNVPGEFLLIQGEEISDSFQKRPIHLNATNVATAIPPLHGESVYETIQNNVNAVVAQRERTGQPMIVHINHPNWGWGITAEDLMRVRGTRFFEVYNGHPGVRNSGDAEHPSIERIWDIMNTRRLVEFDLPLLYGLGTDDGHNYHKIPSRASEPGRGWVMVLTDELSPRALIDALEGGRFYASSGVALERIAATATSLEVTVRADPDCTYTVEFLGTRKDYERESAPVTDKEGKELPITRKYSPDIGAVLHSAKGTTVRYEFKGDELFVRARVTSSRAHPNPSEPGEFERAWTQPVLGPATGQSS